ncbi:hypothetical protein AEO54_245 [Vibrio phage vB_VorS-PVo5]|nr:hypothetical protein AEO54_245 [Vibrio phage vB_VorS-PVo5]
MKIKLNGKWRDGEAWVRVGGKWRKGIATWIRVGGVWKKMAYAFSKIVFTQQIADTSYGSTSRYGTIDIEEFGMDLSDYPCKGIKFYTLQEDRAPSPKDAWIDIWVENTTESLRLYNTLRGGTTGIVLKGTGSSSTWFNSSNATFVRFSATGNVRITPKNKTMLFDFLRTNRGRTITMTVNIND